MHPSGRTILSMLGVVTLIVAASHLPAVSQVPASSARSRKGVMLNGRSVNLGAQATAEATRSSAIQGVRITGSAVGQPRGIPKTVNTASVAGASVTGTSEIPAGANAGGGSIWGYISATDPGDTTGDYPPAYVPPPPGATKPLTPWTGVDPKTLTEIPSGDDLVTGMQGLTGNTGTPLPPGDSTTTGTCKCCGAPVTAQEISNDVQIQKDADAYVAYQVWHVDHFSGNFWHKYSHSRNTCVTIFLGDQYGRPFPAGTSGVPWTYSPQWGCSIPAGVAVDETEGPGMPNENSFTPPNSCPECGRHDDTWNTYLVFTGKMKVRLLVTGSTPDKRWALVCANGHDQSLECDLRPTAPSCSRSECPDQWDAYYAALRAWRTRHPNGK